MVLFGEVEIDVDSVRLPNWGRVVATPDAVVPFDVVGPDGRSVAPIRQFLRDFVADGRRTGSVRSYGYALLRWWRWLHVIGFDWDKATSTEAREFVLWLQRTPKPRRNARTKSAATAGTINPITRKQYLDDHYHPGPSGTATRSSAASTSSGSSVGRDR